MKKLVTIVTVDSNPTGLGGTDLAQGSLGSSIAPTYIAKAKDQEGKWWRVGAAWFNQKSLTISITLDPFVQLPPGAKLTLYNEDSVPKAQQR